MVICSSASKNALLLESAGELRLAGFHRLQGGDAVAVGQTVEILAIGLARPVIRRGDAGAEEFARVERQLIAELGLGLEERPVAIKPRAIAVGAGKLAVDEGGDAAMRCPTATTRRPGSWCRPPRPRNACSVAVRVSSGSASAAGVVAGGTAAVCAAVACAAADWGALPAASAAVPTTAPFRKSRRGMVSSIGLLPQHPPSRRCLRTAGVVELIPTLNMCASEEADTVQQSHEPGHAGKQT